MWTSKAERNIVTIGYVALISTLIAGIVAYMGNDELNGAFTNGKTENCASFISIEFYGNRFVSVINVRLDAEVATQEHIADRVQQAADGVYFMRVVQRGNFYITGSDMKTITKVFPSGGTINNEFSHTGNEITIAHTFNCDKHTVKTEGVASVKVAVIGSRSFEVPNLENYLPPEVTEIVSGGARGVDSSAREYATANGIKIVEFLPNYSQFGRSAPLKRNLQIIEYSDTVIAFWE